MGSVTSLEAEFHYYREHQAELVSQYEGQFVVIREGAVIGAYPSYEAAYREAVERYPLGSFLIQHVEPGESAYTQTFHSRVA
jgi:hypothetical protein